MKSRVLLIILAVVLITGLLVGGCTKQTDEVIELSYNNFFPPTHLNSILADEWAKEIETRSNGRVDITYYPGGQLAAGAQVYDGVTEGICDIGMSVLAYTMGRFPASALIDMPHGYPNGWVATMVANDFYNEYTPAEFDDVHVLYFHAHGPGVVLTTDEPVSTMEGLDGLVIRSTGVGAQLIEALGAEGYAAGQGDAFELMSKGTIDGSFTPREVLKGWSQAEVVKYVTGCYDVGYTANMFVVMNNDKWNSLPSDIQEIFNEVSEEWIDKHGRVWDYYDKVAIDYFLSLGDGREVIDLPADEMARWVDATRGVKDSYMAEQAGSGLPMQEYEDYLTERTGYWAEKSPTADQSVQWVESELMPLVPAQ